MFQEVLKIKPQLDPKDMQKMQNLLQARFTKIAKNFGKGLLTALKGGGLIGLIGMVLDKILNPLKEVQEAMDKMLKSSDDIATNANQFNTTSGKLFKLVTVAKATGLDQDNLFTLITKFQTAVAQARANPEDESVSAVRNFTGTEDTADAFFDFIRALQGASKDQQVLIQQQIFGEKQILKMADFLQTDFPKIFKDTNLDKTSASTFGQRIDKLAGLNDLSDVFAARRDGEDVLQKGKAITEGMIVARDKSERIAMQKETDRIKNFENLSAISDTSSKILGVIEEGFAQLGRFINFITPAINKMVAALEKFGQSKLLRGLFGGKGD